MLNEKYMEEALKEAQKAYNYDEVPIGCVIVKNDKIIAREFNKREINKDASAHAEMLAIKEACKVVGNWRLEDCDLYVTLEPCPMCSGAIIQSRIANVFYGAKDKKGGCVESCLNMFDVKGFNHYPGYTGGVKEAECGEIISSFFKQKRKK